ncbi:MAG: hypothetical protein JNL82_29275 [Myxococcales bacterium]|nr:hypothetical protein [Myxococcales bacterium]
MQRLRTLAPWLLAAGALAVAVAPYVPKDIFTLQRLALGLAGLALLVTVVLLVRRRRARPRPAPDPHAALTRLARRALARSLAAARRALGRDPARTWLVLGPPQQGKTSLIAGLGPLRDLTAPAPPGAVLPRFFLAGDTLLIEHPAQACDLRPLLRLRRPLDAILLVLSLPDLADAPPDLTTLRARLDDIQRTLAVSVPIHLIATRLDRLAGHHELAGDDLTPWGVPLASPTHLPAALRTWSRWVDAQRLARLADEPDPERRARLFTFSAAFARAGDHLADLAPLFDASPLRSVFFLATRTDPNLPGDRVLHHLAARLHLPLRERPSTSRDLPLAAPDLGPLLTALRAHDSEAARTPAHHRRINLRLRVVSVLLLGAALGLALTATDAATDRRACLQTLADLTAPLALPAAEPRTRLDPPTTLDLPAGPDPRSTTLDSTATLDTDAPAARSTPAQLAALHDLHARLGRDDCAADLDLPVVFRRAVRRHILPELHAALGRPLRRLDVAPPVTVADHLAARDRLRAYLLLTADLSEAPGPLDPAQKSWLADDLPRRWSDLRPTSHPIAALLATFLDLAAASDLAFPRDHALVARARAAIHSDDDATLEAALAAADCEPLALRNLTHAAHLVADRTLPCAFTRPGWTVVQQQLAAAVDRHDGWILGNTHAEPRDQRLARLRDRYDARYIAAWTDFLAGVRVRRPADQASAARLLTELTADDRPISRVFAGLEHHTRGLGRSRADIATWIPGDAPAEVHRAFAPLLAFTVAGDREPGLARWHARLAEVLAALEAARSDPAAVPALRTTIAAALADTHDLLRRSDVRRFRPLLTALLLPPLEALQSSVTDQDKLALVRAFCLDVHAPLRRLARLYPFDRDAADDVPLADFTALFHPESGALARLRTGDLAPYLTGHGDALAARPAPKTDPHPLHPRVVHLLVRAAALADLAFPKGQVGLDLDVDLRCNADISKVTLIVGAARHAYTCGPDPRARMRWPGDPPADKPGELPPGALLELVGRDGRRQQLPGRGPWGLYRLLEKDGVVTPPADPTRDPLVFRFDLRASRLGTLDLALTPARTAGQTLLFGPGDGAPTLLAPLRTRELLDPPTLLFQGLPGCNDLDP